MEEWPIWKVWLSSNNNESLWDLQHKYSYRDLLKMNSVLSMEDDYKVAYDEYNTEPTGGKQK